MLEVSYDISVPYIGNRKPEITVLLETTGNSGKPQPYICRVDTGCDSIIVPKGGLRLLGLPEPTDKIPLRTANGEILAPVYRGMSISIYNDNQKLIQGKADVIFNPSITIALLGLKPLLQHFAGVGFGKDKWYLKL